MNLAVLAKSRRHVVPGDVFAMLPPDGKYLFGRVISTRARPLGTPDANLIYIYRVRAGTKKAPAVLDCSELLLAPVLINRLPWSRGYFEHLQNRPLGPRDRLLQHCFADSRGRFFDEEGNPLTSATEPVGQWGLDSYRTVDDRISEALGLIPSQE